MKSVRVWFNKTFSSSFNVIQRLVRATSPHAFHVLCSHTNSEFVGFQAASEKFVEPPGLGDADYVKFCLDFCSRHGVEVFVPGRSRIALAENRGRFEELGVRMLVPAAAPTLHLLENKAKFYTTLAPAVAEAPRFLMVRNAADFSAAVDRLKEEGRTVCFKPSSSTGGLGFRILDDRGRDIRNLLGGENIRMTTALAQHILAQEREFPPLLVMEYCDGAEYSIDCLSAAGRLLCAIPRRKPVRVGGVQVLEENAELVALAGRVAAAYELDGIFNVQVRYLEGVPKVLEINARMSGGVYFACLSGVDLPAYAIALAAATATPEDIPKPRLGLAVHQQYAEFVYSCPAVL